MMGFVVVSEIGKKGDLVGRTYDGKCAIIRQNGHEIKMGEVWFGNLAYRGTYYFFEPVYQIC